MVTIDALVARLRALDVKVWLDQQELRVNAPTGALTPELRSELSGRRAELRAFLAAAQVSRNTLPELVRGPHGAAALPLSFAQERFLFLHELDPNSLAYAVNIAFRLTGPLKVEVLRRAWQAVVHRHETLSTTFSLGTAHPVARRHQSKAHFDEIDTAGGSSHTRLDHALARAADAARVPFNLESGPIARLTLVAVDQDEHLLLVSMHHIVSDLWSLQITMRDLAEVYNAELEGRAIVLPPLTVQYADYAAWQRTYCDSGGWDTQLHYWRTQLAGVRLLDLPTDKPRPPVQRAHGETLLRQFPLGLVDRVKVYAAEHGVSAPMVYLAVFFILLRRYTGDTDHVVGQPVGGRLHPAVENLVGLFLNTVAMRLRLEGDPTTSELLQEVRRIAFDAYSNQDYPFERLIAELGPVRDTSRSPIVQVTFNVLTAPAGGSSFRGLDQSPTMIERMGSQLDLSFMVEPDVVKAALVEYNTDLFDTPRMERLLEHYERLLIGAISDPSRRISQHSMLTEPEAHTLLRTWNATDTPYPADVTVAQLIEAQAVRTPDAVAVVSEGRSVSYAELNERANRLAHHLRRLGAGPDVLVGVGVERSIDMMVAVLGVAKSGAAYVPLDPAFPSRRLAYMIEDSRLSILITQQSLLDLWGDPAVSIVCLDTSEATIAEEASTTPVAAGHASHLAYVIYTSGSTGKPKGVQVSHGAIANFVRSMSDRPGFAPGDVMLAVTTLSFDIAGLELYVPLACGGTVVIATREEATDGAALLALVEARDVTVLQATPATFRLLLEAGWVDTPRLRVLCGGEPMPTELADAMLARAASVWNMYGPTETTVWSTIDTVAVDDKITIGKPIANTQVYVLDAQLHSLPVGVPGELYLAGSGVARGYLGRPALTAERFVPDPFTRRPGARMYRTGDVARFMEDGRLECLGRVDNQVKVRGFRIESGEIETALAALPSIRESAVVARPDASGTPQLVAYVVVDGAVEANQRQWREALKATLPDYMVPGVFVRMDKLPLTANGKVDRHALPAPSGAARERDHTYQAPESGIEQGLARIWESVLTGARVGLHDNFFDLGGHSLLLAQIRGPIEALIGRPLSMVELFQYPTVSSFARHVSAPKEADQKLAGAQERARLQRQTVKTRSTLQRAGGTRQ
jgi:amino acid adenylation domain-containing protein